MMPRPHGSTPASALRPVDALEPFAMDGLQGVMSATYRPAASEIARILDPASAVRTLQWGHHYLYLAQLQTTHGIVPVVVKQFRNDGLRAAWRRLRTGREATRAWRTGWALLRAGVATPEPVLVAESREASRPSFLVTRFVPETFEVRHLLRAVNAGRDRWPFSWTTPPVLLEAIARAIRDMHDRGIVHRDVSSGNVLVQPPQTASDAPAVLFVDLGRARFCQPGILRRSRDLCRLWITGAGDRLNFVNAYWRANERRLWWKIAVYSLLYHGFRAREAVKPGIRRFVTRWRDWVIAPRPNPHIPDAPAAASWRDRTVWDPLSDQPCQKAGRWQTLAVRVIDAPAHAREYGAALSAMPRIWRRYRTLQASAFAVPVRIDGPGVCLTAPAGGAEEALVEEVAALGVRRVLLRVYPWDRPGDGAVSIARALVERGVDVAFSVPQNRALASDPARWAAAMDVIAGRFAPLGRQFQIGQAINRSKWGVWTIEDYYALVRAAAPRLRRVRADVEIVGPPIIDFEYEHLAAAVNMRARDVHFDIVSSLLYVDRRGAPERRQVGFDTGQKVALLRAIADTARLASPRAWITETNWALREGPYSPAGGRTCVDEETQANYLVRYLVLALAAGHVERVYWWQLAARGYGLLDPVGGTLRRRPSFDACAAFIRELEGAWSFGPVPGPPGTRLFRFRRDAGDLIVGWTAESRAISVTLPGRVRGVMDRDGRAEPVPRTATVQLDPSPRYFAVELDPA